MRLTGFVASPTHSRANAPDAVSVSQRPGDSRSLAAARPGRSLSRAAADGRLSDRFLRIDMPAEMVDVNVHPTKLEVRFQESGRALQPTARHAADTISDDRSDGPLAARRPSTKRPPPSTRPRRKVRHELVAWAKGEVSQGSAPTVGRDAGPHGTFGDARLPIPSDRTILDRYWTSPTRPALDLS